MKTMIVSDFAALRSALLQLLGICLVIGLFMSYTMGARGHLGRHRRHGAVHAACSRWPPWTSRTAGSASASRCPSRAARWCSAATPASGSSPQPCSPWCWPWGSPFLLLAVMLLHAGRPGCPKASTPAENPPAAIVGSTAGSVGIIMVAMAVALPLIMRCGMTKAATHRAPHRGRRHRRLHELLRRRLPVRQRHGALTWSPGSTPAAITWLRPSAPWLPQPSSTERAPSSPPSSTSAGNSKTQKAFRARLGRFRRPVLPGHAFF